MRLNHLLEADNKKPQTQVLGSAIKDLDRSIYTTLTHLISNGHLEEFELTAEAIHHAAASGDDKAVVLMLPDIANLAEKAAKKLYEIEDDAIYLDRRWLISAIAKFLQSVVPAVISSEPYLKLLLKHHDEVELGRIAKSANPSLLLVLDLSLKKLRSSAADKKFHKENDTFVFIGRPKFEEVPPGSGNYKKTLEIEKLIKVDPYNVDDHKMIHALKLRARAQGENSQVFKINLPKGVIKDRATSDLPDWLVGLIDKNKEKI